MMLKWFAVLGLTLLPLAASAQIIPQAVPPERAAGITVSGGATVRYPVKTLAVVAQARGNNDEQAVLDAMRAAGVDDPVIGPIGGQFSPGMQTVLRGTVHNATREKLERLQRAAADFARSHPGTTFDGASFFAAPDACAAHENEVRAAALADAKRKAQAIAALAGVTIEGIAAVSENGGCPIAGDPYTPSGRSGPPLDLGTLTASLTMSENVTFAIAPATGPTRRRAI
jgi:uncharacterized protein YggE